MTNLRKAALFACTALMFATPALADIDNTGTDTGNVFEFGAANTATYGQTFFAGAGDTSISSFSLFLRDRFSGAGTLDVRGYLATWTGSGAGTLVYESATQTMNDAGTLQQFSFSPNVAITAGGNYVAFLSVSNLPTQAQSTFSMPVAGDTIANGQFVFQNNGTDFASLFANPWSVGFLGDNDIQLTVDFNGAVPEPAAWALMIAGFGLAGTAARSRKTSVRFA